MLTSLFGDLRSIRGQLQDEDSETDKKSPNFAATRVLNQVSTDVNDRGQLVDRHVHDLVITGSPAQAIRDHFATTRANLEVASRHITLLDPTSVWAGAVIKGLSDASGRPIERLHLREQGTLRTLAMIERTTLERGDEGALRIFHADVRAPGPDNAAIPVALMERSHMTAVIVGALSEPAVDALLQELFRATTQSTWRCPTLSFMLPPQGDAIAHKIEAIDWPERLRVQCINESLTSTSAVWNALLSVWNRVKGEPTWDSLEATPPSPPAVPASLAESRRLIKPSTAARAIAGLAELEGLLGCAVVHLESGLILAKQAGATKLHQLELAAAASAQVLRSHQRSARDMGLQEPIDEVITSAGGRQQLLRPLARHSGVFLFALLDIQLSNLAQARFKLMEAEQRLSQRA